MTTLDVAAAAAAAIVSSPIPTSNGISVNHLHNNHNVHNHGRKTLTPKHSMSFNERTVTQLKHSKDMKKAIKKKFDEAKAHINLDLDKYNRDLRDLLEKSNPEWRETLEKLSRISDQCRKMSNDDFWLECKNVVEELDKRRQELPIGTVKRAHTSLLFILTRCTRLVQVLHDDNNHQQLWFLNSENFRGK